jgi:polysaccharide biosynthesis/export protein
MPGFARISFGSADPVHEGVAIVNALQRHAACRISGRALRGLALAALLGLVAGCSASEKEVMQTASSNPEVLMNGGLQAPLKKRDNESIIERGDSLEIIVRRGAGEEKYGVTVLSSGVVTVSFQDIKVEGLTEVQAEEYIRQELSKVIKNPRVQVRLAAKRPVKPKSFYIFGEVKAAGKYLLERDATLLHALGQASGYTDVAALDKVVVISRPQYEGQTPALRVANVQAFLEKGDLRADIPLEDNDVIFIPRDKVGDWNHYYQKAVLPVLNSLLLSTSAVLIGKSLQVLMATPDPAPTQTTVPVCWVASVLYGERAWQTTLLRWYIVGPLSDHAAGRWFADLYRRYGQQVARTLERHPRLQSLVKPLFDRLLVRAIAAVPDRRHGWPPAAAPTPPQGSR